MKFPKFSHQKHSIFLAGFILSMSVNAFADSEINEKYDLGGGAVFFVDPSVRSEKTTKKTVDYFVAQCDHLEIANSNRNGNNGQTTTHVVTLTLTPCERTDIRGVKAHPIPDDMVLDTFDGVVKHNLETRGLSKVINAGLYRSDMTSSTRIGSEVVDFSNSRGSTEDFQRAADAKSRIDNLIAACEAEKKSKLTEALGDAGKADQIISALSLAGEGIMRMEPALEENKEKCSRRIPYQHGVITPNETK